MSQIKPITTTYGEYPHTSAQIYASVDPQTTYGMLRDNLLWQLTARIKDTTSKRIRVGSERKLQKLIRNGWCVEATHRLMYNRGSIYTLTRPRVTSEEAAFLGWK